jgi:hypothetical protein
MGSVARLAAVGAAALALAACAVIAGLDDPAAVDDGASGSSSSGSVQDTGNGSSSGGSSSGSAASDSSSDGASSSGKPADAQPDVPACTLLKMGDTCAQPSECCSGKCNEKRQCVTECEGAGSFNCDLASTDECCVGLWCNSGSCSPCIMGGQPAAQVPVINAPISTSCCSRQLQGGTGPNCQ